MIISSLYIKEKERLKLKKKKSKKEKIKGKDKEMPWFLFCDRPDLWSGRSERLLLVNAEDGMLDVAATSCVVVGCVLYGIVCECFGLFF